MFLMILFVLKLLDGVVFEVVFNIVFDICLWVNFFRFGYIFLS